MTAPAISNARTAAQLDLFAIRCTELAERVFAGRVPFLDGVDLLFDAAQASGLLDDAGADTIQQIMAASFASAREAAS